MPSPGANRAVPLIAPWDPGSQAKRAGYSRRRAGGRRAPRQAHSPGRCDSAGGIETPVITAADRMQQAASRCIEAEGHPVSVPLRRRRPDPSCRARYRRAGDLNVYPMLKGLRRERIDAVSVDDCYIAGTTVEHGAGLLVARWREPHIAAALATLLASRPSLRELVERVRQDPGKGRTVRRPASPGVGLAADLCQAAAPERQFVRPAGIVTAGSSCAREPGDRLDHATADKLQHYFPARRGPGTIPLLLTPCHWRVS